MVLGEFSMTSAMVELSMLWWVCTNWEWTWKQLQWGSWKKLPQPSLTHSGEERCGHAPTLHGRQVVSVHCRRWSSHVSCTCWTYSVGFFSVHWEWTCGKVLMCSKL